MNTLLLDTEQWDLVIDAAGNIAMATDPYAMAQDVASECRLFVRELPEDPARGVDNYAILSGPKPSSYIKDQLERAAYRVPTVIKARAALDLSDRKILGGQVQVTNSVGISAGVTLT